MTIRIANDVDAGWTGLMLRTVATGCIKLQMSNISLGAGIAYQQFNIEVTKGDERSRRAPMTLLDQGES